MERCNFMLEKVIYGKNGVKQRLCLAKAKWPDERMFLCDQEDCILQRILKVVKGGWASRQG